MGYALLMQRAQMYGEQVEAMEKVNTKIGQAVREQETGLPAIAALVPPLNADEFGGEF